MRTNYPRLLVVLTLLSLIVFKFSHAAIPASLNYQGHLTDASGVPIDGPVNIVFAIYDVASGGTALWSDTRSVTVDQGVFSEELGGGLNPFPLGLFEQPLWMGLTVGTDAEMTPRRPLSSTAYSFKADDANTLEGVSVSTLDQSAHVLDTANPHAVTPAQIGAADATALSAHTSNTSNPHSVTAAQTGAASSADFTTHTGDASAHHTRYSNAEAVAAMGATSNTNPLNHNRYGDGEAVAAIIAADGAGSTLDADLVDGLQAAELIDAAQDEVRTPISSLPFTISQPGSYYLTGNLDGSSGGIDILANRVTLDLMGFTIDGGGSVGDYGIFFNGHSNIVIRNGFVTNFGFGGIIQNSTSSRHVALTDVQALGNGTLGVSSSYSGIHILGSNHHIERCTAGDSGGYGIYAGVSSKLLNNTVYNNGGIYGIAGLAGSVLSGNTAYNNNGTYGIYGDAGSTLSGNAAYNNAAYGIYGNFGSTLSGNTAFENSGVYGIFGGSGSTLNGNSSYSHNGAYAIFAGVGSNLIGNTAYSNTRWGIYASSASLIKDNTLYNNNISNTAGEGGLRVAGDSRVVGNALDNNEPNNIVVTSSDNILIGNHVTDANAPGNGILFNSSGNYYRENTGSGNTIFIELGTTSQTDGGGNVSF